MKINYNVSAHIANAALSRSDKALSVSTERLSSGYKINSAKDDASGLAISRKMNAQIRGLETATQSANDGISVIETAEGALSEIEDMTQRMKELSTQAANGTNTTADRETIQKEVVELQKEITRIAGQTEFNGQPILDGTYARRGYTDNLGLKVDYISSDVDEGTYTVSALLSSTNPKYDCEVKDGYATITSQDGFEVRFAMEDDTVTTEAQFNTTYGSAKAEIMDSSYSSMTIQIGTSEGQTLDMTFPEISLKNMGIDTMDVSTLDSAREAVDVVDDAVSFVSSVRSTLGAYENRLEHTVSSLDVTTENTTSAYSRIMDVDMAEEMTRYTSQQVLVQAGTSMLSQANQRPEQVLQLIQ